MRIWVYATTGALGMLGAMACGIALNLVQQPHPGWPTPWLVLAGGGLALTAAGATCATAALWLAIRRMIEDEIAHRADAA